MPPLPQPQQRSAYLNEFDKTDPQTAMACKFTRVLHLRLLQAIFATKPCLKAKTPEGLPGTIDMLEAQSITHVLPLEILIAVYCQRTGIEGAGFKIPLASSITYSFATGQSDEFATP